jgi:acyl-CoA thioester hydrolase
MHDLSAEIEVAPAFYDVDPMGVVWHGHYLRFFELARSALLSRVGYDYEQMRESGYLWPVVDVRLKYVRPATLKQRLVVRAEVVEWEQRLKIDYMVRDALSQQRLTKGYSIQVAVEAATQAMQYVCPRVLWEKLGVDV